VETAARSMVGITPQKIEFKVDYIFRQTDSGRQSVAISNPFHLLRVACRILAQKPDLLIVSLWRSCIVGMIAKALYPRLKLVLFLHLPNHVHCVDRLFTRFTARFAAQIWADSRETLVRRLPDYSPVHGKVISFVTQRVAALLAQPVKPVFIFWGRIHRQKGLDRALGIFAAVQAQFPASRFMIIGPDGGDLARLETQVKAMKLSGAVSFLGAMDFNGISQQARTASFYLQTSLVEGMAMSVVEAMQLGLVPVVSPAGEIGNYARHSENALIVMSDETVVSEIVTLLHDDARYQSLRKNAVATWAEKPLYAESVMQACRDMLREECR
jgi:glycosyltransferase involved in cell wall biosynthesis